MRKMPFSSKRHKRKGKQPSPLRILRFVNRFLPVLGIIAGVLLGMGFYFALFASPPDYRQGEAVRIMYVHVPSAWIGMAAYGLIALFSLLALIQKHPLYFMTAEAIALPGAVFCFLCLVTGAFWGRPIWGVWWSWDARLTSMLILLFLYFGYMALIRAFDDPEKGRRAAALLALVGAVNLPIIKFSVDWWRTLHQPSSLFKEGGSSIAPEMLTPLLLMIAGTTFFFLLIALLRLRGALLEVLIRRTERSLALSSNQA